MACSAPGDCEFSSSPAGGGPPARACCLLPAKKPAQSGRSRCSQTSARRLAVRVFVLWREGDQLGAVAGIANCAQHALDRVFDFARFPVVAETMTWARSSDGDGCSPFDRYRSLDRDDQGHARIAALGVCHTGKGVVARPSQTNAPPMRGAGT